MALLLTALGRVEFRSIVSLSRVEIIVVFAKHLPGEVNEYFINIGCGKLADGLGLQPRMHDLDTYSAFWHLIRSMALPIFEIWRSLWRGGQTGCPPSLPYCRQ